MGAIFGNSCFTARAVQSEERPGELQDRWVDVITRVEEKRQAASEAKKPVPASQPTKQIAREKKKTQTPELKRPKKAKAPDWSHDESRLLLHALGNKAVEACKGMMKKAEKILELQLLGLTSKRTAKQRQIHHCNNSFSSFFCIFQEHLQKHESNCPW